MGRAEDGPGVVGGEIIKKSKTTEEAGPEDISQTPFWDGPFRLGQGGLLNDRVSE